MRDYTQMLKLEKADEGKGASGYVEPKAEPTKEPQKEAAAPEGEGDKFDDLGYEKIPEGDKKPEGKPVEKQPEPKEEKIENPATGYGDEPPKVEEEAPPPPKKEEIDLGFELKTEGFSDEEANALKKVIKKYGISKEKAEELLADRKVDLQRAKEEQEKAEKDHKANIAKIRAEWHKELKADPNFGGEKFAQNVLRAERVVQDFMPNTKKILTERKTMLPPYVMRDLAKIADHLFSSGKLVQGDPIVPKVDKEEVNDELAFYT